MDGWWGRARRKAQGKALNESLFGLRTVWLSLVGLLSLAAQAAEDNMSPVDGSVQMVLHLSNGEEHAINFPQLYEFSPSSQCWPNYRGALGFSATAPEGVSAEEAERRYELSVLFDPPRIRPRPMLWVHDAGKLALHIAPDHTPGLEPEQWVPEGEVFHYNKHWYLQLGWNFAPGRIAEERSPGSVTPTSSTVMLPEGGDDVVVERAELNMDMRMPATYLNDAGERVPCPPREVQDPAGQGD